MVFDILIWDYLISNTDNFAYSQINLNEKFYFQKKNFYDYSPSFVQFIFGAIKNNRVCFLFECEYIPYSIISYLKNKQLLEAKKIRIECAVPFHHWVCFSYLCHFSIFYWHPLSAITSRISIFNCSRFWILCA